jgi:hypothetical protein
MPPLQWVAPRPVHEPDDELDGIRGGLGARLRVHVDARLRMAIVLRLATLTFLARTWAAFILCRSR